MATKTHTKAAAKKQAPKKNSVQAHYRLPLTVLGILLVLGGAVAVGVVAFARQYDSRLLPQTSVGSIAFDDVPFATAQATLQQDVNDVIDAGITLTFNGKAIAIDTVQGDPANPELAVPLVIYHADETMRQIQSRQAKMSEPIRAYYAILGSHYQPVLTIDEAALREALHEVLADYESPAEDAGLAYADEAFQVVPATSGTAFDYDVIMAAITEQLLQVQRPEVAISLVTDTPDITDAQAQSLITAAQRLLSQAPYSLTYDDKTWEISSEQAESWITAVSENNDVVVGLDPISLGDYIQTIANEINVPVKEAKFSMANGRVKEFQPSQTGLAVDVAASVAALNAALHDTATTAALVVGTVEPEQTTGSLNDMGITELIGEGRSNFSGSPANRRHNIQVGADALNGLIIKPGEEFSLIKALGEIDGEHGYKQELVIKGNKTVPEYGGGLCQIGTTTFRSVLDAGLKVTERRNHSYRVSYYEPAGTDATIYDPAPDFKFVNDTGHHVLLTTEIDGNDLIFRLYGTSDGRQVSMTDPHIYNFVAPGPTKLIETTDLAPGVKKCTERAHTGADADFTRTITYADGQVSEETFHSHYKPWQEVCLIGVEEAPAEEPAPAATGATDAAI